MVVGPSLHLVESTWVDSQRKAEGHNQGEDVPQGLLKGTMMKPGYWGWDRASIQPLGQSSGWFRMRPLGKDGYKLGTFEGSEEVTR